VSVVVSRVRPRRVLIGPWLVCLVAIGGCAVSIQTFHGTVDDLQAEAQYNNTYSASMASLHHDIQRLFGVTATNPGVCNVGGSKQGCYDADLQVIQDYHAMLSALAKIPVPRRFADGDRLLRQAIDESIRGLQLRNQAIAQNDDAAWTQQAGILKQATSTFQRAYAAYPEDNRPQPPP
jgi:hypothetical protein